MRKKRKFGVSDKLTRHPIRRPRSLPDYSNRPNSTRPLISIHRINETENRKLNHDTFASRQAAASRKRRLQVARLHHEDAVDAAAKFLGRRSCHLSQ